jgi:hypothetical protein
MKTTGSLQTAAKLSDSLKRAVVHGCVAEGHGHDAVLLLVALGEGDSGRERDLPPHDPVAASCAVGVEEVHRAPPLSPSPPPSRRVPPSPRRARCPRRGRGRGRSSVHAVVALAVERAAHADRHLDPLLLVGLGGGAPAQRVEPALARLEDAPATISSTRRYSRSGSAGALPLRKYPAGLSPRRVSTSTPRGVRAQR